MDFPYCIGPSGSKYQVCSRTRTGAPTLVSEQLGLLLPSAGGGHTQCQLRPCLSQDATHRRDQRLVVDLVGGERLADLPRQVADLVADDLAVHHAQPLQYRNRCSLGQPQVLGDLSLGGSGPYVEQLDAWRRASRPHLLFKTQKHLGVFEAGLGDKATAPAMAFDEAVVHKTGERLADGRSADAVLLAELGFRRNGITGLEISIADALAEMALEAEVIRDELFGWMHA